MRIKKIIFSKICNINKKISYRNNKCNTLKWKVETSLGNGGNIILLNNKFDSVKVRTINIKSHLKESK